MPDAVVLALTAAAGWLLTYLVHSTVLLLGAWVLSRGDRFGPATRDLLWKTAILGGLATSAIAVAGAPAHARVLVMQLSTVEEVGPVEAGPGSGALHWTAGAPVGAGAVDGAWVPGAATSPVEALVAPWTWFDGLVLLWVVGALLGLGGLARQWAGLRTLREALCEPSERMARLFSTVLSDGDAGAPRMGGGPIGLRSSSVVDSPCVLPGRLIVLPHRCDDELNDHEMLAVLAHEVAHVRRRDPLWTACMTAVGAVLWLQPLNRLGQRASRQAAEDACDDFAVASVGDRLSLATSIARVARWTSEARLPVTAVAMVGRRGPGLSDRVGRILGGGAPRSEPRWARILLAALLLLPLRWLPAVEPPTFVRAAFVSERLVIERSSVRPVVGPMDGRADGPSEIHLMRVRTVRTEEEGAG